MCEISFFLPLVTVGHVTLKCEFNIMQVNSLALLKVDFRGL